jgi:tricarballylate dehydrogenase
MAEEQSWDVVVVGAGNAAICAALSAAEQGAKVLVIEKAPVDERGGNSLFTARGFRFVHEGLTDLRQDILDDLSEAEVNQIVLPPLSKQTYLDDLMRVTEHNADESLAEILIGPHYVGCASTRCASSRCSAVSLIRSTASITSTAA